MQMTNENLMAAVGKLSTALLCSVRTARTFAGNGSADLEACDLLETLLCAAIRSDKMTLRFVIWNLEGRDLHGNPASDDCLAA